MKIYECDGQMGIRHKVGVGGRLTKCGKKLIYDVECGGDHPWTFHAEHECPQRIVCRKCYPKKET